VLNRCTILENFCTYSQQNFHRRFLRIFSCLSAEMLRELTWQWSDHYFFRQANRFSGKEHEICLIGNCRILQTIRLSPRYYASIIPKREDSCVSFFHRAGCDSSWSSRALDTILRNFSVGTERTVLHHVRQGPLACMHRRFLRIFSCLSAEMLRELTWQCYVCLASTSNANACEKNIRGWISLSGRLKGIFSK